MALKREASLSAFAERALEAWLERLEREGGREPRDRGIVTDFESMVDESFGLSIQVHDPDGLPIQINEHDPELHEE